MDWLRLYTEITRDRKLRRHPYYVRWIWVTLLCLARSSPKPGTLLLSKDVPVTIDDIADEAAATIKETKTAVDIFLDQNMLTEENGVYVVSHFQERQFISDNSTERVRNYRERKKKQCDTDTETNVKRFNTVTVTPPDTDTDTDTDTIKDNVDVLVKNVPCESETACQYYQGVLGRLLNPVEIEQMNEWEDLFGRELTREAIKCGVRNGKLVLNWLRTVLDDWKLNNIKTAAEVAAYEEKRRGGKGNGTSNTTGTAKTVRQYAGKNREPTDWANEPNGWG